MSQARSTASRRDIRRAFGPEAVETLNRQGEAIHTARLDLNALAVDHALIKRDLGSVNMLTVANGRDLDGVRALLSRGFVGRLRWLVTGR